LLFGAIPMFGIALAYFYLNAWRSDAGAAYSWVGRTLDPSLGFLAGWSVLVANMLFMVVGSLPLASATLDLVAPAYATNTIAVTGLGLVWFVIVVGIVLLRIEATAFVQKVLTIFQISSLLIFAGFAFAKGSAHPANPLSWSWFGPIGNNGFHSFWAGALVAIFYFWGWDATANLSEETIHRSRVPGLAGIAGLLIVLALFVVSQVAVQLVMSASQIANASSNLLVAYAGAVMPHAMTTVAVILVIVSTIAVLQVSLVMACRTMFSMGRDRVLDERFAHLNSRFLTPWNAAIVFAIVTVALFALAATSASINQILTETINAIGVLIAFYYGLSGIACARHYRAENRKDRAMWWLRGVWPIASALFVFAIALTQLATAGFRADVAVIGLLLFGAVPMLLYRHVYKSSYYAARTE
jgi:amino acid transporter